MNKPISMMISETNDKIVQVCNESGLPMSVLELIVRSIYNEIKTISDRTLEKDKSEYMSALSDVIDAMQDSESDLSNKEVIDEKS